MGVRNPDENSFVFQIDDKATGDLYDAFIDFVNEGTFGSWCECRYRKAGTQDKWIYLSAGTMDVTEDMPSDKVKELFASGIKIINGVIAAKFSKPPVTEPTDPFDLAAWLVETKLTEFDNVITIK